MELCVLNVCMGCLGTFRPVDGSGGCGLAGVVGWDACLVCGSMQGQREEWCNHVSFIRH